MKKLNAFMGTLAASIVMANAANAAVSTTSVTAKAPKLIDKVVASYWGAYAGPSVTNPTRVTTDVDAGGLMTNDSFQNLDSTLTAGWRINPTTSLTGNYRFIYVPMTDNGQDFITKDPWVALKRNKLINVGNFNLDADLRAYVPVQNSGKMNTAIRSTQTATYAIPNSRLTLGTYTILRANFLKEAEKPLPNAQAYLSGFGNYQLTPTLAATLWSDIVQLDYSFNKDLQNKLVLVSLGMNWDITPKVSVNPSFNFFPGNATLERTTVGMILSASIL
jgi:hypothetical protein